MCICGELNRSYENKLKCLQPLTIDCLCLQDIENILEDPLSIFPTYVSIYCCITTNSKFSGFKK